VTDPTVGDSGSRWTEAVECCFPEFLAPLDPGIHTAIDGPQGHRFPDTRR
jgi:hypothetical protein